jgi:hypothetical protein
MEDNFKEVTKVIGSCTSRFLNGLLKFQIREKELPRKSMKN